LEAQFIVLDQTRQTLTLPGGTVAQSAWEFVGEETEATSPLIFTVREADR